MFTSLLTLWLLIAGFVMLSLAMHRVHMRRKYVSLGRRRTLWANRNR